MNSLAEALMRGTGPVGFPGAAEVVNMRPPAYLIKQGVTALPCIGDGRQSGTSGSPSILNASPEAAVGGYLGLQRRVVGPLATGAIIEGAEKYQKIDQTFGIPRDNH
jgi:dihydroxy-acid dehydratase